MADAKSTHYGPGERGLATILPQAPNLMGIAMQAQNQKLRQEQLEAARQAKLDAARDRAINALATDLMRPVPTAFEYQSEVNKMKDALLESVQASYLKSEDPATIRFNISKDLQRVVGYAKGGQQVIDHILKEANDLDPKIYKKDAVVKELSKRLVGPDGKMLDPSTLDMRDLTGEEAVFQGGRAHEFLNENAVMQNFLKNPVFTERATEIQKQLDSDTEGRFTIFRTGTNKMVGSPVWETDAVTGKPKILDAGALVDMGIYNLALDDRAMAAVLEGDFQRLTEGSLAPIGQEVKDMIMAEALKKRLEGSVPQPDIIEKIGTKIAPTRAGGGLSISMTNKALEQRGSDRFVEHITSSDPAKVKLALDFLNKELSVSEDAKTGLSEAIGANSGWAFQEVIYVSPEDVVRRPITERGRGLPTEPGMYAKFDDNGRVEYQQIDQERLAGEFGRNVYSEVMNKVNRNFLDNIGGEQQKTISKPKW